MFLSLIILAFFLLLVNSCFLADLKPVSTLHVAACWTIFCGGALLKPRY